MERTRLVSRTALAFLLWAIPSLEGEVRSPGSLNGDWKVSTDQGQTWRDVQVPGSLEEQIASDFDGTAWLRRTFESPELLASQRLILHFDAIATEAEIFVNGHPVGRHLGGWTPIRCDISEALAGRGGSPNELLVKVDEKVGHNTQGFLPVIAPHFGGIWQDVALVTRMEGGIDDLRCQVWGDLQGKQFQIEVPFAYGIPQEGDRLCFQLREAGKTAWSAAVCWSLTQRSPPESSDDRLEMNDRLVKVNLPWSRVIGDPHILPRPWSPDRPDRYQVRLRLMRGELVRDEWVGSCAFRTIATDGRQLLLNGKPCIVRGLLNWGYQQGRTAPPIDPRTMREEIKFAKARGFNLMKFCLWVPPKDYFDLLDELGMLGWVEYPAWHPQFTQTHRDALAQEYTEFFHYDRSHPSIILRSLTCETGPSADVEVIRALYDRCHELVPNALVEDDSSWIEWNRIHDFYDDHPYGNNDTWVATLDRLNRFVAEREAKPLILGEAIAADTWYEPAAGSAKAAETPPIFAAGNREWRDRIKPLLADGSLDSLQSDSHHYAHLMRKYQIETYRRVVPQGGYVVSVIRDFSLAGMGLIDYFNQPKTTPADWEWHGDRMLLLHTEQDRRSFCQQEPFQASIDLAGGSVDATERGILTIRAIDENGAVLHEQSTDVPVDIDRGNFPMAQWSWPLPRREHPTRIVIDASLLWVDSGLRTVNRWPIWSFPIPAGIKGSVLLHPSWDLRQPMNATPFRQALVQTKDPAVLLARRLDGSVLDHLEKGGNVLLVPDGGPGSPIVSSHWFLRGGPVVNQAIVSADLPRAMFVELQHFDLASSVIPDLSDLERFRPLIALWDNHDIPNVKTHGLALEIPVGKGWLLVSSLKLDGDTNSVGHWLLGQWMKRLAARSMVPDERGSENLSWLREQLSRRELPLSELTWRIRPDAENQGEAEGWFRPEIDDSKWETIRTDRHWESQGHDDLDGWAWYRVSVSLPEDWPSEACYLSFTGVDDYYRCYVNGNLVGTGGDLEQRKTAFDERKSHDIARYVKAGEPVQVAVQVYDWYGAGGIFRPVTLTTSPLSEQRPLVQVGSE